MKKQKSKVDEVSQFDSDNLADVIWWIKGYHAYSEASFESCDFTESHIESLRKARLLINAEIKLEDYKKKKKKENKKDGKTT